MLQCLYQTKEALNMVYDSHVHTTNSDGKNTLGEMCLYAIGKGFSGITITDHADMNFYESRDTYNRIERCIGEVRRAQKDYAGKLDVLCGVELGEYLYAPESAEKILSLTDYDCILCSVHYLPEGQFDKPYNRVDFANVGTDDEIRQYLRMYFDLLYDTVQAFDFDVLAHLACPTRYITTKHKRPVNLMEFEPQIRRILQFIIDRNVALEYNSAGLTHNEEIFSMYHSMGGRLITLGSDAHYDYELGKNFNQAVETLKKCGFTQYHYFKNRQPLAVDL